MDSSISSSSGGDRMMMVKKKRKRESGRKDCYWALFGFCSLVCFLCAMR